MQAFTLYQLFVGIVIQWAMGINATIRKHLKDRVDEFAGGRFHCKLEQIACKFLKEWWCNIMRSKWSNNISSESFLRKTTEMVSQGRSIQLTVTATSRKKFFYRRLCFFVHCRSKERDQLGENSTNVNATLEVEEAFWSSKRKSPLWSKFPSLNLWVGMEIEYTAEDKRASSRRRNRRH